MVEADFKETVARLKDYHEETGGTISDLAIRIGTKPSTLSELLSGTYKGSGRHILVKIRRFLNLEASRKWRPLEKEIEPVPTSAFTMVTAACRYAQERGVGALITADAGAGKTTALKSYARENPNVFYIHCNETMWGRAQLLRRIGQTVGLKSLRRTFDVRRDIVDKLFGTDGILLIDDAHFLGVMSLNAVQTLHDEAGVGFVLAGVHELHSQMSRSKNAPWFAQILSRCAVRRAFDVREVVSKDVIAVARSLAGDRGLDPAAENLLVEEARTPGGLRRVEQIIGLALTFTKGALNEKAVRKAIAYRGGI